MNVFIYELIDPITNETRYIGKTKNLNVRYSGHLNEKVLTYKGSWIKGLVKNGLKPILNVIDKVESNEADYWECFYISLYKSWNCRLTNGTKGGEGGSIRQGMKNSKEHREKIKFGHSPQGKELNRLKRESKMRGAQERLITPEVRKKAVATRKTNYSNWHSQQTKDKISKANKGKVISQEQKDKQSQKLTGRISPNKGNKLTDESRKQMSESHKGLKHSEATLEKLKTANIKTGLLLRGRTPWNKGKENPKAFKAILQCDLEGNLIQEFKSLKEAVDILGIYGDGITNCCKERTKQCKGFIFKYKLTKDK